MTRKHFFIFISLLVLSFNQLLAQQHNKQPNVVFILVDDIGSAWLPPYAKTLKPEDLEQVIIDSYNKTKGKGKADAQKHIEAAQHSMPFVGEIAEKGTVFNMCFTTSAICSPSRSGIITAKYQTQWGLYSLTDVIKTGGILENSSSLIQQFRNNGYETGLIGKWHVSLNDPSLKLSADKEHSRSSSMPGKGPLDMGFNYYYGYNFSHSSYYNSKNLWEGNKMVPELAEGEFLTDVLSAKANNFVEHSLKENKPFFLYYAPMTLHGGFDDSPKKYSSKFNTGVPFTDSYAGHLLALDEGIKAIYNTISRYGEDKNTIFILCSDNGSPIGVPPYNAPFKGGKGTGWLGGSHSPLIIYMPGKVVPQRTNMLVSTMDILPTALDFADIKIPQNLDGVSLKPMLTGLKQAPPHQMLFSSGANSSRFSYSYYLGEAKKTMDSDKAPMYTWGITDSYMSLFITKVQPGLYNTLPNGKKEEHPFYNIKSDPLTKNIENNHNDIKTKIDEGIKLWMKNNVSPEVELKEQYKELKQQIGNNSLGL